MYPIICHRLLKEGGVWVNFGPLLFHWSDSSLRETDERFKREFSEVPQIFGGQDPAPGVVYRDP